MVVLIDFFFFLQNLWKMYQFRKLPKCTIEEKVMVLFFLFCFLSFFFTFIIINFTIFTLQSNMKNRNEKSRRRENLVIREEVLKEFHY